MAVPHLKQIVTILCPMWQNVQRYQEDLEKYPENFADLFEEPKGWLPPKREFHHAIPLLPGAEPINVRQLVTTCNPVANLRPLPFQLFQPFDP
jgi:hypothetical protein